jgi:preprotein translocase subunit SecY
MLSTKNSYILYLVVLCTVLIASLIVFGNMIFEEIIPVKGIGAAIGMFTFIEIVSTWLVETKSTKIAPRKTINLLMGIKTGKILLTLLFVAVYTLAVNVETQRFVIVFLAIYLVYLFSDTVYLTRREKKLKANRRGETGEAGEKNELIIVKNES